MERTLVTSARLAPYEKRPKHVANFTTSFIHEASSTNIGTDVGTMVAVIEVLSSGRIAEEVAELVIETAGNYYYSGAESAERAPEEIFEKAVKQVNLELAKYIERGNTSWVGKISAVVAVVRSEELILTQTGTAEAYLYRNGAATQITDRSIRQSPQPHMIFGTVASGKLMVEDKLLLGTSALFGALKLERLHQLMLDNSPASAIGKIKEQLSGENIERVAAIGLQISNVKSATLQVRPTEPEEHVILPAPSTAEVVKAVAVPMAQKTVTTGQELSRALRSVPRQQRQPVSEKPLFKVALPSLPLDQKKKLALVGSGAVFALFALVTGVAHIRAEAEVSDLEARYGRAVTVFQQAEKTAETDKVAALTMLKSASSELNELKRHDRIENLDDRIRTKADGKGVASVSGLAGLISARIDKLEGLEKVGTTTLVSSDSFTNGSPSRIFEASGHLMMLGLGQSPSLYRFDPKDKSVSSTENDLSELGNVSVAGTDTSGTYLFLGTSEGELWRYNPATDGFLKLTIAGNELGSASALTVYNSNLYVLAKGSVYKHLRTSGGYSEGRPYATSSSVPSLSDAVGLFIDGSVLTAGPKGLTELSLGSSKLHQELPQALRNTLSIRGGASDELVVLTDTKTNRIGVVKREEHSFTPVKQILLGGIKQLNDGLLERNGRAGYALADGQLLSFDLSQ